MTDVTEYGRRVIQHEIHAEIKSMDETSERTRLEAKYGVGNVWDTDEVTREFEIIGFMAPFVVAIRRSDNVKGSLTFQHEPRFYFNFREA